MREVEVWLERWTSKADGQHYLRFRDRNDIVLFPRQGYSRKRDRDAAAATLARAFCEGKVEWIDIDEPKIG